MANKEKVYRICTRCHEGFSMLHGGMPIPEHGCKRLFEEESSRMVAIIDSKLKPPLDHPTGSFKFELD